MCILWYNTLTSPTFFSIYLRTMVFVNICTPWALTISFLIPSPPPFDATTDLRTCLRNCWQNIFLVSLEAVPSRCSIIVILAIFCSSFCFKDRIRFYLSTFFPLKILKKLRRSGQFTINLLSSHSLGFQENCIQWSRGYYTWAVFQADYETPGCD